MASQNFIDPSACLRKGNEEVGQKVSERAGMCPDRSRVARGQKKKKGRKRERGRTACMVDITIELKLPNVIHLPMKQAGGALY